MVVTEATLFSRTLPLLFNHHAAMIETDMMLKPKIQWLDGVDAEQIWKQINILTTLLKDHNLQVREKRRRPERPPGRDLPILSKWILFEYSKFEREKSIFGNTSLI